MLKVVVIGSGNVAQHLIAVFKQAKNVELVQAFARNPEKLSHLLDAQKITDSFNKIKEADIYIISVTDDAISQVSSSLPFSGRLVVHTSGTVAMDQLDAKNRRGVFYPLQTFSKNKEINFSIIPLCLESEKQEDYNMLEKLAKHISKSVYNISSQQRKALHVAAVFVSNFANHMYAIGSEICLQNGIPFDILKPLILETADKVLYLDPLKAQTGPAVRNDKQTIKTHLDFITDTKQKEIYKLITQSIQNVKKL